MTTKFIGMKDFRQNLSKYTEEAHSKNVRYIVLKKNTPVLEINPIDGSEFAYVKLAKELSDAEKEDMLSHEEMMKALDLE